MVERTGDAKHPRGVVGADRIELEPLGQQHVLETACVLVPLWHRERHLANPVDVDTTA